METKLLAKLLVLVDGSESAIASVQYAVRLAAQVGSELHAVYVVDTETLDALIQLRIFVHEERLECEADLERTGRRYLEYAAAIGGKSGVTVHPHLKRGVLHQEVLHLARELAADGIVLGGWCPSITRKDAACLERQLILSHAECPVLIIRGSVPHAV